MGTNAYDTIVGVIKDLGPILIGFSGLIIGYWFNNRTLEQRRHEDERKEIYKKLNSFYGPFLQLLGRSRILYELLVLSRGDDFRTLNALLAGEEFEGNDKTLLDEILRVGERLEELIYSQSGLVDDPELRPVLVKASAHFGIIRLARDGALSGEVNRFKEYVFPRDLGPAVEHQAQLLQERLKYLNTL